jgi:hypothetical protein
MLREIWRTIFLMDFASRLYRGDDGKVYLADAGRWNGTPQYLHQIPEDGRLALLSREACWARTQMYLIFATVLGIWALMRITDAHIAWLLLAAPLGLVLWIGQRGETAALSLCARFPTKGSELILTRQSELAQLHGVTFVRIFAVLMLLAAFAASVIIGTSVTTGLPQPLEAPLRAGSFFVAFGALRLIIAGGHVINPDRLNLAFENSK